MKSRVCKIQGSYDSSKEWSADPKGYFLIKVFYDKGEIGVRWCDYEHKPLLDVFGTNAEALVQTLVREGAVSRLQHAAYLGHELHKAEVALQRRIEFIQDEPLDFAKKATGAASSNTKK
jgi:tetrahydromethanopterin S-methyltransferase subunit A